MLKKIIAILFSLIVAFSSLVVSAATSDGSLTYKTYTYNNSKTPYTIPAAYTFEKTVDGRSIGVGGFSGVSDVSYSDETESFYIADSENNRIVVTDKDFTHKKTITGFTNGKKAEKFSKPGNAFFHDGKLYITDTGNGRIVCLNEQTNKLVSVYTKPKISALGDYSYSPLKVTVDDAGRMYVIARDITDGILLLDENGQFKSFFGAPKVEVNAFDEFRKRFMTKEQREKLYKSIPTEFNSMAIDEKGFLYVTTQSSNVQPISRLNYEGVDVLTYTDKYPMGDEVYSATPSAFVDITVDESGCYYALDSRKGRVFCFDKNGELLFVFGGAGTQEGTFISPISIESVGNRIIIADITKNTIEIFKRTAFCDSLFSGISLISEGEYDKAKVHFDELLRNCSTYIPAHLNLGRIAFQKGDFLTAMKEYEYAGNDDYYSVAFKEYRKQLMNDNLVWLIVVVGVIAVALIVLSILKKRGILKELFAEKKWKQDWKYVTHCCFHPFDGFWCVRREGKGNLKVANIILVLFMIFFTVRTQFSGYLFNKVCDGDNNEALLQLIGVVVPLMLWVVANWCLSTLFNGEARLKDVYITVCYSLKPYLLLSIPLYVMTFFLSIDEAFLYTALNSICWIWILALIFFGTLTVQDFSLIKGIVSTIFTLVGIALIIFIALIVVNIVQEIITYVGDRYTEIIYRLR